MERNVITMALSICLTLGFFSVVSAYLPAKTAGRTSKQLLVKAEPVTLTEVLDNVPPLPAEDTTTAPADSGDAVLPFWMESGPVEWVDAAPPGLKPSQFPLKIYKPLPAVSRAAFPSRFRPHADLLPMIEFWRNVYANYDLHHTLLHDAENLNLVYGVLDLEGINQNLRSKIESIKKAELKAMLLRLDQGEKPVTAGEHLIAHLFENIHDRDKFKTAANQIRGQWGQRSRFEEGLIRSGRYLPTIEKIFEAQGVPKEISRLVFVESMFVPRARSRVGAAGPWQFMPATARRHGLVINSTIDERHDPLIAAQAAARLLRKDHHKLENWPLAINAYNTGAGRMERAAHRLHTRQIHVIIRHFEDRAYQFASRNFYPEFLAALEVVQNYPNYFGGIELEKPVPFDELKLKRPTSAYHLALKSGTDPEVLKDLNQAYHPEAFRPGGVIPEGYVIRVPHRQKEIFASLVDEIHTTEGPVKRYVVQRGDTLLRIADRHRTTLSDLKSFNGLIGHQIQPGQVLKIPGASRTVMLEEEGTGD
ncbi:MAG: transglycosylase SLT domain-containing protein [Deltaproteobacteria bacterium]|nr:transglycosylase SLT domain-containing protein [Deltaproteobacteria bacterium]MBI4224066.1 transglycosylase SLT domain-containing protein [Deltaproteobacteria bacterium]